MTRLCQRGCDLRNWPQRARRCAVNMRRHAAQAQSAHLRGLLFPQKPALRPRAERALHHLSAQPPRGAHPTPPALAADARSALGIGIPRRLETRQVALTSGQPRGGVLARSSLPASIIAEAPPSESGEGASEPSKAHPDSRRAKAEKTATSASWLLHHEARDDRAARKSLLLAAQPSDRGCDIPAEVAPPSALTASSPSAHFGPKTRVGLALLDGCRSRSAALGVALVRKHQTQDPGEREAKRAALFAASPSVWWRAGLTAPSANAGWPNRAEQGETLGKRAPGGPRISALSARPISRPSSSGSHPDPKWTAPRHHPSAALTATRWVIWWDLLRPPSPAASTPWDLSAATASRMINARSTSSSALPCLTQALLARPSPSLSPLLHAALHDTVEPGPPP